MNLAKLFIPASFFIYIDITDLNRTQIIRMFVQEIFNRGIKEIRWNDCSITFIDEHKGYKDLMGNLMITEIKNIYLNIKQFEKEEKNYN
jgi:hypothetical protein